MKTKLKEFRDRSTDDLKREILDQGKHIFALRSQAVTEKLEDPTQIRKTRRTIALLKTLIREREIAEEKTKATTK